MFGPSNVAVPLEISLLGGCGLRVGGRDLVVPRKTRALLAFLAAHPTLRPAREVIAKLLWPRNSPDQARHSLRQALLELRHVLDAEAIAPLQADATTVRLMPGHVWVDIEQFQSLAGASGVTELAAVEQLYRGPFLDRFPPIGRDFDQWVGRERTGWVEQALALMGRLADLRLVEGDDAGAVALCERMLGIDALREEQHRRLMRALAVSGRTAEAVRQYHSCVAMLHRDLNGAPSEETNALYQRIRDGGGGAGAARRDLIRDVRLPEPGGFATKTLDRFEFDQPGWRGPEPRPRDGPPWIAILPLRGLGPDPVPDYFAAGLVEDITGMLAAMREVVVISAASGLVFRDQPTDLRRVRDVLGVRYVVSGTISRIGRHLRTYVELAEVENGAVLWTHRYLTADLELFTAQEDIAQKVVGILVPTIHQAEMRRIKGKPPESLSAYDLVLRARDLTYRLEPRAFEQAGQLLRRAIALDPGYAAAHTNLAQWFSLRLGQGWSPDPGADARALEDAAGKAIRHDFANARALAMLGHNRTILKRDYDGAMGLLDRALSVAPNDAESLMWSSPTLAFLGETAEAIRRAERANLLAPHNPFAFRFQHFLCNAHYWSDDCEAAAHWGLKSLCENPNYTSNIRLTIASLVALGRIAEAHPLASRVMELQPDFRVAATVDRHASLDVSARERYRMRLIEAGLPP